MVESPRVNLGVLISGGGTNLQAIIDSIERGELHARVRVVISNRRDAYGLRRARRHGIPARVIDHRSFPSREAFDSALVEALNRSGVELVVCAGFMRLLSPVMLEAFPNRIMNIHPALLPSFPGIHAQKDALDYGVRFAGCTVFLVSSGVDNGPIIVQAVVPVRADDTEESLSARILAEEHRIYPWAIRLYQQGRLKVRGRKVDVEGFTDVPLLEAPINPPIT